MDCPPFLPSGGLRRAGNPGGECPLGHLSPRRGQRAALPGHDSGGGGGQTHSGRGFLSLDGHGHGDIRYTPEDRIAVTYYDGVVNNISLDETLQTEKTSNWSLQGGITVGSSKEDLDKVYGACTMSNEQDQYFVYYYDSSHTLLTEDHIDDVDYMVSFILEEDGLLACAIGSAEPALEPSSSP